MAFIRGQVRGDRVKLSDSSPAGASQLRDSPGIEPGFAAAVPTGPLTGRATLAELQRQVYVAESTADVVPSR